jgi:hypothetical protein
MSKSPYLRIGELLIEEGLLTSTQLKEALSWRTRTRSRLGEVLTELGFVREENVIEALARQFEHPMMDITNFAPTTEAIDLVPQEFAIENVCLPLWLDEVGLHVAIADPLAVPTIDALNALAKVRINLHLATPTEIKRAINKSYVARSNQSSKPRHTRRQKDRDQLLDLLASVEPHQQEARRAA